MKSQMLLLSAMAMITAPLASAAPALAKPGNAGGAKEIQQFCRELVASGDVPWLSMGECVSLNLSTDTEKGGFTAHRCDNWRDSGELELVGFSSYSDCIHNFNQ
jgi:hypothetical protein